MNTVFPFGFSGPTAFYLTIYVLTLVVHVVFMNYVLAGSCYLGFAGLFPGRADPPRYRTARALILRDWMPFALSAAITAGVAPLLFIQILYKRNFYTANLLLFHRWMSILPVLIVGFYLLYVLKSKRLLHWPPFWRAVVSVGPFLCFAFTAWSWTENHLLSVRQGLWPDFYAEEKMVFVSAQLFPRLAVWFVGAFPTMFVLLAWQLRYAARHGESPTGAEEFGAVALLSMAALGLAALCAVTYFATVAGPVRARFTGALAGPYLAMAALGVVLQFVAWLRIWRSTHSAESSQAAGRRATHSPLDMPFATSGSADGIAVKGLIHRTWLVLATIGVLVAIMGMTVVRESVRLAQVDVADYANLHESAYRVGGLGVFLFFFMLNSVLIAWAVVRTKRRMSLLPINRDSTI